MAVATGLLDWATGVGMEVGMSVAVGDGRGVGVGVMVEVGDGIGVDVPSSAVETKDGPACRVSQPAIRINASTTSSTIILLSGVKKGCFDCRRDCFLAMVEAIFSG